MSLGFSVEALLPRARGGGKLRMGLTRLAESDWLDPAPDRAARAKAFAQWPQAVQLLPEAEAPGRELAALLGVPGALPEAARAVHEDLCLLTAPRAAPQTGAPYRLVGAAVAWPSDWHPADKIGLGLTALHAPIAGYAEQLAVGVDRVMAGLRPGDIFGRCNWFIAPVPARRWLADRPPAAAFAHVTPANAGDTLFVRCERQTLRRLPKTGGIVFAIGVYVSPLGELSPANVARLARAVENLISGEGERRGAPCYAASLIGYAGRRGG